MTKTSTHELQTIHNEIWQVIYDVRESANDGSEGANFPFADPAWMHGLADRLEKMADRLLLLPGVIADEQAPDD